MSFNPFHRSPRKTNEKNFRSVLESLEGTNIKVVVTKTDDHAVTGYIKQINDGYVHVDSDQFVEQTGFLAIVIVAIEQIHTLTVAAPVPLTVPKVEVIVEEPNMNGHKSSAHQTGRRPANGGAA